MINYYTYSLRINYKSKSSNINKKNYEINNKNESNDKIINNIIKEIVNLNNNNIIMNAE